MEETIKKAIKDQLSQVATEFQSAVDKSEQTATEPEPEPESTEESFAGMLAKALINRNQ